MNVVVYTTPTCGYCHQAKRFFTEHGVKFAEYDVSRDGVAADEMLRLSGQMGVPVIVVDKVVVVGFNKPRLEQLLTANTTRQHISLGLSVADASKITPKLGDVPLFGAFVGKVAPSSLGKQAGLSPGDIITELNLRAIRSAGDLENALSTLTEGSRVLIGFLRGQNNLRSEIIV